jgi:hypothetical protein
MNARWIRLAAPEFQASCASLAAAQRRDSAPVLVWAQAETAYLFALMAPRLRFPGKEMRWIPWAIAPAVAVYRQFGYKAYLDRNEMCLYGRRIGEAVVRTIGECVMVSSSFLLRFPEACVATPSDELERAFRLRLEAQHGWQFDDSWPTAPEASTSASAAAA